MINRRSFLHGSGAVAGLSMLHLTGCHRPLTAAATPTAPGLPYYDAVSPIIPIRADLDRIFRITVCLRPFRAAGPRLDIEQLGDKTVVHNYGHGGSGWSLSWGSADVVVRKALTALQGSRDIAIIGCGALGLTAAITAQRAGLQVTIYAKERPPFVRSSRATGSWTPDSRIALTSAAAPSFAADWESMARTSLAMYQSYLGAPGTPIEWTDRYILSDQTSEQRSINREREDSHGFAFYQDRIADLTPHSHELPPGATPFPTKYVRRTSSMTFNIATYSRQLLNDFQIAGGKIETREFHSPAELSSLPQRVIINCTGYAARQLWKDESIIPVRGQIAWLVPQEGVNYGINYGNLNVLARRDGIVIQPSPKGDDTGWNDDHEQPDRAEAEAGVLTLQSLYNRIQTTSSKHA
ncbi:FAD-dependent oxidoreductase [Granulicella arctica]|uniref:FAD-dependent oxidoreductase n=1 Tax=Granulicella arctica TaxID=940613 RepID=UPI0021E0D541|nr:FAD-dependent oxidoreductase [Granulicella arctica]